MHYSTCEKLGKIIVSLFDAVSVCGVAGLTILKLSNVGKTQYHTNKQAHLLLAAVDDDILRHCSFLQHALLGVISAPPEQTRGFYAEVANLLCVSVNLTEAILLDQLLIVLLLFLRNQTNHISRFCTSDINVSVHANQRSIKFRISGISKIKVEYSDLCNLSRCAWDLLSLMYALNLNSNIHIFIADVSDFSDLIQ